MFLSLKWQQYQHLLKPQDKNSHLTTHNKWDVPCRIHPLYCRKRKPVPWETEMRNAKWPWALSLLCFSWLLFSLLPLVCLSQLKTWETGVLSTFQHISPKRCCPYSAATAIANNHDNNLQGMPCIFNDLAKKYSNYLLKHVCKSSFTAGSCSYLLSALIEVKSWDFHPDNSSWQDVEGVYCSTGLRKTLFITNPDALLDSPHPSLSGQQSSPPELMCFL